MAKVLLESKLFLDQALLSLSLASFLSFICVRTFEKNKEKGMLLRWLTVFILGCPE